MRFSRLTLERYGPFERLDLPLDPTPGRVNLIVAPNGFGKSVLRRAIGDMLFAIPERTPMNFRFGTGGMRLLAQVVQDGAVISLVRRKGHGNTLDYGDGTAVTPEAVRQLLGGADEVLFRELFGLDTALLRSGGEELIRSQGRLGQVLFAAGGGMGRVREVLTALETQRDELGRATTRHKARPLWSALSAWEQAGADLRRVALRPDGWGKLEREASDAAQTLEALLAEQQAGAAERERLRRIGAIRPWLDRLRAAQLILATAGPAPELGEDFERRWREALEAGAKSVSATAVATAALKAAQDVRAAMSFDAAWLAAEAEIHALAELRGRAQGAQTDLPGVEAELEVAQAKRDALRRALGWSPALDLPPVATVREAQQSLQTYPTLAAEAASAERALAEVRRLLARTQAELAALPTETDVAKLTDLAGLLRAEGDPAARLETGRRKLRAAEAAFAAALAAIPDRPLQEAALGATVAPSEPRLDAADRVLSRAEAADDQARRDVAALNAEMAAARADLAAVVRRAMLPDPDALTHARDRRDALWAAVFAAAQTRPDPAAAVALDRAIREVDAVADALIAHGRDVADAAALRDRLAALDDSLAKATQAAAEAARSLTSAQNDLAAIAFAAGGDAREMAALRAFLRGRAEAIARRGERDSAAADVAAIEAALVGASTLLAEAMEVAAPSVDALAPLLAEADRRIEAARNLAARRTSLAKLTAEQDKALATNVAAAAVTAEALTTWHAQWATIVARLNRPVDETQAATAEALVTMEALRTVEAACQVAARRIADMRAAVALLGEKVAAVAALAPELTRLSPIAAAEAMQRRLQTEKEQAARCKDADQRIAEAVLTNAKSHADAVAATQTLTGLRAALHAETDEAAERAIAQARAASAARRDEAEALRELAAQGGGLSVEALSQRAQETTPEDDIARIAAIETRQADLAAVIEAARDQRTKAAAARDQASTGLDAVDAAHRREAAQAMLARTAEEALVLHAAHALLQAALDRQAAAMDQPLLRRIGMVFHTITGGAHAGVAIEDAKSGQTMVALEADGIARKPLDQLSEGTRDQLYLALRIAALEDYAAAASPLPFVVDDVLQTFDDGRTLASLQALIGLSADVQVIALTHHPHVGALAAGLPDGAVQVLRLG